MAAMNLSNTSDLNKVYHVKEALAVAEPSLVFARFGQEDELPRGEGNSFRFIRFSKFGTTGTAGSGYTVNTTGAPPTWDPQTPADTLVNVTPDYLFGDGVEWNSARDYTSWTDLPRNMRKLNALQAAESIDKRVRDILIAGTNIIYANRVASRNSLRTTDIIDMDDVLESAANLKDNDAPIFDEEGGYVAIISPRVELELMKDSAFRDLVEHQGTRQDVLRGRLGMIGGVVFYRTTHAPTVSSAGSMSDIDTLEQTIVLGAGAYGVTKLMYDNFDVVYTAPGGHGDEWAVKHKLTWKAAMKAVILNDNFMVRLESSRREN